MEAEQQKSQEITNNVQFCLEGFLLEQARRIGFTEQGLSRITIYLHEPKKKRFYCLVRRSHNIEYEQKGRTFFDDKKGCIALAWRGDWHFDNQFPDNPRDDAKYQKDNYQIERSVHANF